MPSGPPRGGAGSDQYRDKPPKPVPAVPPTVRQNLAAQARSLSSTGSEAHVEEMVVRHQLRKVRPNPRFQRHLLNQAGETIAAAQQVVDISAVFALTGAYDAARHCVDAWLNSNGLRAESGDGAHRVRVTYAELTMTAFLSVEDIRLYAAGRTVRHNSEYPDPDTATPTKDDALRMIELAKRFHVSTSEALKLNQSAR